MNSRTEELNLCPDKIRNKVCDEILEKMPFSIVRRQNVYEFEYLKGRIDGWNEAIRECRNLVEKVKARRESQMRIMRTKYFFTIHNIYRQEQKQIEDLMPCDRVIIFEDMQDFRDNAAEVQEQIWGEGEANQ